MALMKTVQSSLFPQTEINQFLRLYTQHSCEGKIPKIEPANTLCFPATDLNSIGESLNRLVIRVNFLGLYGVSSPLPHYFITDALDEENSALRGFLGIFNQIFYQAYFYAWKSKYPHLFKETALEPQNMIADLASTDQYADEFLLKRRSRWGFEALIEAVYPKITVNVDGVVSDWSQNHIPSRLGHSKLSDDLILGSRLLVHGQKIILRIGPLSFDEFRTISPFTEKGKINHRVLLKYLGKSKIIETRFLLIPVAESPKLGDDLRLGLNCSLGKSLSSHIKKYNLSQEVINAHQSCE